MLRRAIRSLLAGFVLAVAATSLGLSAQETEGALLPSSAEVSTPAAPSTSDSSPTLARSFGSSGLLAEFNSNENFGNVQARLGAYRTHQAAANAGGPTSGYRDRFENWIIPLKATVALPDAERRWYVRLATTLTYSRGQPGNLTRTSTDSYTKQLHVIRRFGQDTAVGVGLIATDAEIGLRHNGGTIDNSGRGIQLDVMHGITPQFGIAGRLIHDGIERRTSIPLAAGSVAETKREGSRTYVEASLVFALDGEQSPLIPENWRLRPVVTGVYQRTVLDRTLNDTGLALPRVQEEYAAAIFTSRFESARFAPWRIAPYVEAGAELLLKNEASQVDNDPANIYLRAGLAMNVGGAGRLDFYVIRRDSLEGTFDGTNFSVLLSLQL